MAYDRNPPFVYKIYSKFFIARQLTPGVDLLYGAVKTCQKTFRLPEGGNHTFLG